MLRNFSLLTRLPLPAFRRVPFAVMSMETEPVCAKFIPVEQSGITSISNPEGICEECLFPALTKTLPEELDEYDSFYRANMEQHGYSSIYIQRSGQKQDGCGVFYKQGSAELVLQETIDYNDLVKYIEGETKAIVEDCGVSLAEQTDGSAQKDAKEASGDPNDPRVRLKRDCVGIIAAFRLNDPSRHVIIIANTYLLGSGMG